MGATLTSHLFRPNAKGESNGRCGANAVQTQTFSGLAGAIWQVNDKLSFGAAVRYAVVNGRPVQELRVGMTFGFPLFLSQPMSAQSAFAAPRRR